MALDALTGHVGTKNGGLALRGMSETRQLILAGERIGQNTSVLDGEPVAATADEALKQREAELTAELEALRERRGA